MRSDDEDNAGAGQPVGHCMPLFPGQDRAEVQDGDRLPTMGFLPVGRIPFLSPIVVMGQLSDAECFADH